MALDWGKPVYVLKLDIRKDFDSVIQARLGELLFRRLAVEGGKPWEARLWLQLVQRETLLVQTDGGNIPVQQTNAVRQESPDSPVLFAALMGESIGDILARREEGDTSLPFSGSMYMDDTDLWAESLSFLQQQIEKVEQRLTDEGLHINGDKTECVCSHHGPGETILVGGQTVQVRDPGHPIKVLGAPLTMSSSVSVIIATMQQKARTALACNKLHSGGQDP